MNPAVSQTLAVFHNHRKFVLTTHVNPDGDGLGSELALAEWLAAQGKDVAILNCSPTPENYLFLDPRRIITVYDELLHRSMVDRAEVIVVVDTNHPDRLRSMREGVVKSPAIKICIDHHLDPDSFAPIRVIDGDATSTGEIVFRMLNGTGEDITPSMATALYCAIMTDTGSFRYPRVDPAIHRIVAALIESGADPVAIYSKVYEQWSGGRIHLLGEMLASMVTTYNGALAYAIVTRDMLTRTGTSAEDTDNFTTYPMSIAGVSIGIFILEETDGIKLSFRSRGDIPINELAREFGGNGHKNAAGAHVADRTLDATIQDVLNAAKKYVPMTQGTNA